MAHHHSVDCGSAHIDAEGKRCCGSLNSRKTPGDIYGSNVVQKDHTPYGNTKHANSGPVGGDPHGKSKNLKA